MLIEGGNVDSVVQMRERERERGRLTVQAVWRWVLRLVGFFHVWVEAANLEWFPLAHIHSESPSHLQHTTTIFFSSSSSVLPC